MSRAGGGIAAILVASVLWGTTGTAATFAPHASPLAIGAAAMGIGGILQSAIAIPSIRRSRGLLQRNRALVALGAISVAVYPLAFYSSMRLGGVAVGTVVSLASAPLASAILERTIDGTPLTRRWAVAAVLAVGGSALLCVSRLGGATASAGATVASVALGLLAGVTYAVYSWAVHRMMQRAVGRAASMGAVFGLGGALLVPVLIATGATLVSSPQSLAVAAYMALVPMFLGYLLFGIGLERVRPSTATTLTLTEPAVAAVLAIVVVGERMNAAGWAGLALIGVGLVLLTVPFPWRRTHDTARTRG
ncbi:DMT family transporter [Cryobacterium tepidiphilum]|uniref:EamA/RhaT family transporter n=1 Tax=Cryobacterium tepidiphilum TaxID=2486026 RepID=A0A3M8LDP9_9MICO|nr:DMT family transporter [Cryobacterium tepidiphilum]RNE62608.1 EamA/RhaT family transporter [Cryobacterium tepidiphilum]